jgi:outer membrane protein OmpA-like peptidoglycan-associated protein
MKKIVFLLIAGHYSLSAIGQEAALKTYSGDKDLSRWVIDVNLLGGAFNQKMDMANTAPNYLNGVNINTGKAGFKDGGAFGGDLQLGYFFGKNKHFGIGTGLLYLREWGNVSLDNFHAEYQSVDANGFTFRQVVTANSINEHVKIDNFNIPLVLKYKNRMSRHWGFTADAGALFNLRMESEYATNASFDYEAIYKFVTDENGIVTPVYDNASIPGTNDFLITKSHYTKNNPTGNVQNYFDTKRAAGYNVGLGVNPAQKEGTTSYATGSVGFLLQPSVNYFFSDRVALNVGAYYIYQPFKNEGTSTYTMTGKPGEYSSVMNAASTVKTQSFGGNLGLRFFLGKKEAAMNITNTAQYDPSACGACDGSFALQGLKAGETANVSYKVNGASVATMSTALVNGEGTATVQNLCAGSYSDIRATIGNKSANSKPVNLIDPKLVLGRVESENPTAPGACDGTISMYGLRAGQKATVTYTINGVKSTYSDIVSADNSIKVSGLCGGTVKAVTVESGKCVAQLSNPASIVLVNPKPVIPPVVVDEDTMTQILFDFNTATIRPSSYVIIDRVFAQLKEDKDAYVVIDGNTDEVGTDEYNQKLSERRAAVVRTYLMNKGISNSRIEHHANGEREPVATNQSVEGRSKNRRAELLIKIKK